jgi:hypothetical protein
MYLHDAREDYFFAKFLLRSCNCKYLSPVNCHRVLEIDSMDKSLLFISDMLENLFVKFLIENKDRHFCTLKHKLDVARKILYANLCTLKRQE